MAETREYFLRQNGMCNECMAAKATGTPRLKRPAEKDTEQLRSEEQPGASGLVPAGKGEAPPIILPEATSEPHSTAPPPINWSSSWYEILGVARNAQIATIKAAYRRLSGLYHPDKAGADHTDAMQRISHIYDMLSNSNTQKAYNKTP